MLSLVEPQSSGIGGGAFILYWDNQEKKLHTYDGRETAPASANAYTFIQEGKPMKWRDAVVGGLSVGVPGVLRALEMAHSEFGTLEWEMLFEDTINTSREGFIVSERLERLVNLDIHPGLNNFVDTQNYFKPNGVAIKEGQLLQNGLYAKALLGIAKEGADYFYKGPLAEKIAKATRLAPINPGNMQVSDLKNYQAKKRTPICGFYRDYKICGMAPPSSGGINVFQILKSLERFDFSEFKFGSPEFAHLFAQSSALAFADRSVYIADSDFTRLAPVALINPSYIKQRSSLIGVDKPFEKVKEGKPYLTANLAKDNAYELPSTSHISIVDRQGNAVSMTTSVEFMFGSGVMVEGFLLNNQLTDFSLSPSVNGSPVLNRVEPNKRPRSSMSPTMVFDNDNNLKLVLGSPGGSRIINYVAQTMIGVLDYGLDVQQAINFPRITNRNDYTALEKGTSIEKIKPALEALGHKVQIRDLNSGIHAIQVGEKSLIGGADPRREGIAVAK
jgi:gamma-glutamyltranspeptidase/glutathione hydrolase